MPKKIYVIQKPTCECKVFQVHEANDTMRFVTKDEAFQLQQQMFDGGVSNVSPQEYQTRYGNAVRICTEHRDDLTETEELYDTLDVEAKTANAILVSAQNAGLRTTDEEGAAQVTFSVTGKGRDRVIEPVFDKSVTRAEQNVINDAARTRLTESGLSDSKLRTR